MRKNLMKRLKKTLILVGILTLSLSATACGKSNTVETSSTAIETIAETKDFSMNLAESQLANIETLSDEDLATYQSEAQELEDKTSILPNGEVVEETTYEAEELKLGLAERLKGDILSGEIDIAILDEAIENVLDDYDDDYRVQVKEEIQQAYNEKFVSSNPTQVAQNSKPSPTQSTTQLTESSKSDQPSQLETQPQPTQPKIQESSDTSSDLTPEQQEELQRLMDEAAVEWQDSDANDQVKWDGEERNITIK